MTTTPSKEAQMAEAAARAASGNAIPPNETARALDTPGDGTPQDPAEGRAAPAQPPQPEPQAPREPPQVRSPFDDKRAQITARFRTERNAPDAEKDEITDFTRSGGMPEDFRQFDQATGADWQPQPDAPQPGESEQPAADAAAAPEPAPAEPAPAPQLVKIKVRGEEKEVPLDDVIAKARIAFAADDYLDEAKGKLNEVNSLLRDARDRAARPGPDGQPQADPNRTHAEPASPSGDPPNPTEDPLQKAIEAIQFGDPAEAKTLLGNIIRDATKATTREEMIASRIRDDAAAANKALAEFQTKHADIANDPKARAVIEADIFEQQTKDLQALNVDFNRIRNDGRPATPADIANYHQLLRSQGYNVSPPSQMLEKAHGNFLEWKGIKQPNPAADPAAPPAPPQPPQQQRSQAPRVEITVDRQQRRQAAPPQPARPAPAQAPQPQAPRDRSDVVQAMKDRRAKLRGSTLGVQ